MSLGESVNNQEIEKSCNSAVSNVDNIITAIQKAQKSASDLNLRVFADNLKSMSDNSLLDVKVACENVNNRRIDIDNALQQLKVKKKEAEDQLTDQNANFAEQSTKCGKMKENLAQMQKEYSLTEEKYQ